MERVGGWVGGQEWWIEIAQRVETERDCHHHHEQCLADRRGLSLYIFKPAEQGVRRGRSPACPPARASLMLLASAKLKDAWCHVLFSEGVWRLSVTVRASVLFGLSQTGFMPSLPILHTLPPHVNNPSVCDKWSTHRLCKLHIHCSCGPADSWRRAVDLCSLSPSFSNNPASSSPMFPWNRPVIFTAVSWALCQGESGKERQRQKRVRERG